MVANIKLRICVRNQFFFSQLPSQSCAVSGYTLYFMRNLLYLFVFAHTSFLGGLFHVARMARFDYLSLFKWQ